MSISDLSKLPVEQKIGQLFFIGIPGPELDDHTRSLLEKIRPGGVCLFARNIREAGQTRRLLDGIKETSNVVPFLSLDQEGGLVDRLRRLISPMPAANRIRTADAARHFGSLIAETIRILGFNSDFAPVVDVIDEARASVSNGLHSRAFGSDAAHSAELAAAFLQGLQSGGIIGCLKHFPGLGASKVDSHEELPLVPVLHDELDSTDLLPYKKLLNDGFKGSVMVAHAAYPKLDLQETAQNGKLLPSSLSYNFVTKLLRQHVGFEGVVITDDLEMGAIVKNFGVGEACKKAILAGEDMLAICADAAAINEGYEAVSTAVRKGTIKESRLDESLARISQLKSKLAEPLPFDPDRLAALSGEITDFTSSLD